jgi:hydroxymethylbilane synthase
MSLIKVAARDSLLSCRQVEEVLAELQNFYPKICFLNLLVKTTGDLDLESSLVDKDKTDFFTKEVDDLVLRGICDIAVHSAKDLPDPLPEELEIIALTKGVDPADVLVLQKKQTLESLPFGAWIGTSSLRRMEKVQELRKDLRSKDIRGTIQKRLELLQEGFCDGVIMAKAALIRLGLLDLNWIQLDGSVAPLQGKLAICGRKDNFSVKEVFKILDTRVRS